MLSLQQQIPPASRKISVPSGTFFLKTKSFPKKTIVFVKNFKTFLKKLEELSENFKVFSKGTLQLL